MDVARSAVDTARHVIAQINPRMPRTHGDGFVHVRDIDAMVWQEMELPELKCDGGDGQIVGKIGHHVASLIEDGATLQLGIGNIPDQVLINLTDRRNLGLHTEMLSDGVIPLIESGVINNSRKEIEPGFVGHVLSERDAEIVRFRRRQSGDPGHGYRVRE